MNSFQRKKKVITDCEHHDREFYAKGMCKNCYHKYGRNKPANCCPNKKMYALGLCQNCYMKHYGKEKRGEKSSFKIAAMTMAAPFINQFGERKLADIQEDSLEEVRNDKKMKRSMAGF
jgi:hypothetical protein